MSTDRDVTRIVRSWLEQGVTALPDRVLDNVLDQLPATPQRRSWWPARRLHHMNGALKLAIAAAAIVVVAVVGINLMPRQGSVGGPSATPSPAPTQDPGPQSILGAISLDPGTYSVGVWFPVQFDLTITDKWDVWDVEASSIVRILKPMTAGDPDGRPSAILTFEIVGNTYSDPCQAVMSPQIGDGVDDLVTALTNLPGFVAGPVTDVSVDGHAGKTFELDRLSTPDPATCVDGGDWLWTSDGPQQFGTGAHQRIIVLDVDGTRLLVDAIVYSGNGLEMDAIIDSIDFK